MPFFFCCVIALLVVALIVALAVISVQHDDIASYAREREIGIGKWKQCDANLSAAQKQIVELRNQTPGRDKSGRFVKSPKGFDNHGSE